LLKRRLGLHPFFDFLFDDLDLGLVVGEQLFMPLADKGISVMLGQGLDHGAVVDELFEPERQFRNFADRRRHGGGRCRLETLAIIGQRRRVTGVGFGPFSLGLAGRQRMGGIEDGDEDFSLVAGFDHGTFIAAGGFADHMRTRQLGQFFGQPSVTFGVVFELELMAVEVNLESCFGHIHSDIDGSRGFYHSRDRLVAGKRDLTQPYACELAAGAAAQATVRVWSTGSARLKLGYGLATHRPRVERARAHRRCSLRRGTGLSTLPKQGKQKKRENTAIKQRGYSDTKWSLRGIAVRRWAGCCTRLATLAFVPQPAQRRIPAGIEH